MNSFIGNIQIYKLLFQRSYNFRNPYSWFLFVSSLIKGKEQSLSYYLGTLQNLSNQEQHLHRGSRLRQLDFHSAQLILKCGVVNGGETLRWKNRNKAVLNPHNSLPKRGIVFIACEYSFLYSILKTGDKLLELFLGGFIMGKKLQHRSWNYLEVIQSNLLQNYLDVRKPSTEEGRHQKKEIEYF